MLKYNKLAPAHHVTLTAVIGVTAVKFNPVRGVNHHTVSLATE